MLEFEQPIICLMIPKAPLLRSDSAFSFLFIYFASTLRYKCSGLMTWTPAVSQTRHRSLELFTL